MYRKDELLRIMNEVKSGRLTPDEAVEKMTYRDLGFAKSDCSRSIRHGVAEVIFGEGKTADQITQIAKSLLDGGEKTVLITRMSKEKAELVGKEIKIEYDEISGTAIAGEIPVPNSKGEVLVCCAGTSDLYCANEAMMTLKAFGCKAKLLCDVGVAGIHRILEHADEIANASVIIAIAGMEGALASVIGGLASCPVIGVATSVGYGTGVGGAAALMSMLNSCSSNVCVVNIDNGFGAGYIANMICNK